MHLTRRAGFFTVCQVLVGVAVGSLEPIVLFSVVIAATGPSLAAAQTVFAPVLCDESPGYQEVEYAAASYSDVMGSPSQAKSGRPVRSPSDRVYADYVTQHETISANRYAKKLGLRFVQFSTEAEYDYLEYGRFSPALFRLSGHLASSTPFWLDDFYGIPSLQARPALFTFVSDNTSHSVGYRVDRARVTCDSNADSTTTPIVPFRRHRGLLLGPNDVVYFRVAASAATADSVVLWGTPAQGSRNYNLWARCNALPTPTAYTAASIQSGTHEYLHLEQGTCVGTWYLAVTSAQGAGGFSLMWSRHFETQHKSLRAGFQMFTPTADERAAAKLTAVIASKMLYGASEGTTIIERVDSFDGVDCAWPTPQPQCGGRFCDICFIRGSGVAVTSTVGTIMQFKTTGSDLSRGWGNFAARELAHEMGHAFFGSMLTNSTKHVDLDVSGYNPSCDYSIMGAYPSNRFTNNFCWTGNHGRGAGDAPVNDPRSMWTLADEKGLVPWTPTSSPDNWSFAFNGFADKVGYMP